jgi:hypothetical protein
MADLFVSVFHNFKKRCTKHNQQQNGEGKSKIQMEKHRLLVILRIHI